MAHVISNECIACGSCEAQCPVNAISMGDGKYEINPILKKTNGSRYFRAVFFIT